jgi:hypothetical protein
VAGLVKRRPSSGLPEYVSLGAGLATFALFSLSAFQLPHYMNIVFPFFAILTAQFLVGLPAAILRRWTLGQTVIGVLVIALSGGLLLLAQPGQVGLGLGWVVATALLTFLVFRANNLLSLVGRMVGTMLVLAGVLNLFLYPTLLQYQAGMTAARFASEQPALVKKPTLLYMPGTGVGGGSFWTYEFYAKAPTYYVRSDSALRLGLSRGPQQVFTSAALADSLEKRGFGVESVAVFPYYHVSQLSSAFLNRNTRSGTLSPYVLVTVGESKSQ